MVTRMDRQHQSVLRATFAQARAALSALPLHNFNQYASSFNAKTQCGCEIRATRSSWECLRFDVTQRDEQGHLRTLTFNNTDEVLAYFRSDKSLE